MEKRTSEGRTPERRTSEGRTPERRTSGGRAPERRTSEGRAPERRTSEGRTPERRKPSAKKPGKFWVGYGIYMCVLAALVAVLLVNVWKIMKQYEKAQPIYVLDALLEDLKDGKTDKIEDAVLGRFEKVDNYADVFSDTVKGRKLGYRVKSNGEHSIVYSLLDGKETVAEAELVSSNERKIMGILSIADWKAKSVSVKVPAGSKKVRVTLPDTYTVKVNGIELAAQELTGDSYSLEGMDYVTEYVQLPKIVTYEVSGLIYDPKVEITDGFGAAVDISDADLSDVRIEFKESGMPQDLKDHVERAAKDYSNFFSKDLPGCYDGTACIQPYFPEGSYYIDLAEQYRTGDMWMYSAHYGTEFRDFSVTEYIRYNDVCFSCRIVFDKYMVLSLNDQPRTEHYDQYYYYVNIGGNWLIADMKSNI